MEDWGAVRDRLEFYRTEGALKGHYYIDDEEHAAQHAADIRAALERIKELEKELAEARRNG